MSSSWTCLFSSLGWLAWSAFQRRRQTCLLKKNNIRKENMCLQEEAKEVKVRDVNEGLRNPPPCVVKASNSVSIKEGTLEEERKLSTSKLNAYASRHTQKEEDQCGKCPLYRCPNCPIRCRRCWPEKDLGLHKKITSAMLCRHTEWSQKRRRLKWYMKWRQRISRRRICKWI